MNNVIQAYLWLLASSQRMLVFLALASGGLSRYYSGCVVCYRHLITLYAQARVVAPL